MSRIGGDPVKVLITLTDVEPAVRLNALLEKSGVETIVVSPLDDIRSQIERSHPDVVVFTGGLTEATTLQLVKRELWDGASVVGLADIDDPALHERLRTVGFAELYPKPVDLDEVFAGIRRILHRRELAELTGLYGDSEGIREVLVRIEQMAPVSSTVLIQGESGTGKELVARALHRLSPRGARPFIPVNIGALPETLLESELFGHEKGAFTGAAERRLGRFELANGGTLFLDEIGEAPLPTQVKLLRVLEQREVMRVGGTQPIRVDVRVVAATNRPLREHVEQGTFRPDLYYRLNVLSIYLPPLRERREDIPILVRRFVQEFSREHDRAFHGISADAMQLLVEYEWPGNVRELRNLVESMVVLSPGREITAADIPGSIRDGGSARFLPVPVGHILRGAEEAGGRELEFIVRSLVELKLQVEELRRRTDDLRVAGGHPELLSEVHAPAAFSASPPLVTGIEPREEAPPPNLVTIHPGMTMAEIERAAIEAALRETRGNRRRAADLLGIGERTLYRKLREYEIPDGAGKRGEPGGTEAADAERESSGEGRGARASETAREEDAGRPRGAEDGGLAAAPHRAETRG
ncbi:MAG TPA: sigma-54 dependent transcriptional regulator [Gemmatimonadaceae bacterium]|nr:sigma-54 dependent transcriptional regulator [Gemmatimonadaceae bacterium]